MLLKKSEKSTQIQAWVNEIWKDKIQERHTINENTFAICVSFFFLEYRMTFIKNQKFKGNLKLRYKNQMVIYKQ